ncbi:ATP-binding cassette domain-containing protein, partial [Xanthomonas citri pv. citri]|nr:ATP-binding cassette domain-containing protein [Xanthomonas citri pv. citri]
MNNVSVSFTHSGVHLLMGESGSGKSTLINLLAGLDTPDSGSVYAEGVTVSDQSEASRAQFRLRHIAVIFQDDNLIA